MALSSTGSGRRGCSVWRCVGFGVLSAGCAAAPSLAFLVGGRAVLGLMAAGLVPASLAALSQLYADSRERARAIGVWAAVSGSAMACGPVIGGFLVEQFGWRSVFLVNPGICLVVLALCSASRLPNRAVRSLRPQPLPHVVLGLLLAAATLAVTEGGERHLAAAVAAACAVLVLVLSLRFLNRRTVQPLVARELTAVRAVWLACGWGAAVNYALSTVLFVVPLSDAGSPSAVGLTLLPLTLVMTLNPLLAARLVARFGALRLIRVGVGTLVVGQLGLALSLRAAHGPDVLGRSLSLLACGLGVSWALPSLVSFVVGHAPPNSVGAVGGVLNASRQLGATLGAAVTASVLSLTHGHPAAAVVVGAVVCVTAQVASAQLARAPRLLGDAR